MLQRLFISGFMICVFFILAITISIQGAMSSNELDFDKDLSNDSTADNQQLFSAHNEKGSNFVSSPASHLHRSVEEVDKKVFMPTAAPYTLKPIPYITFADVISPTILPPNIVKGPVFYPPLDFGGTADAFPKRKFVSDVPSLSPNWSDVPSLSPNWSDSPSYTPNLSDYPSLIPTMTPNDSDMPSLSPSRVVSSAPSDDVGNLLDLPAPLTSPKPFEATTAPTNSPGQAKGTDSNGSDSLNDGKKEGCTKINLPCFSADACCWKNICYENVCTKPRYVPDGYVEGDGDQYKQLEQNLLRKR
jgi:hypothetical protein